MFAFKKRFSALACFCALLSLLFITPPVSAQENMLWAVEDGLGSKMFLYGSIHMASPDIYPLPPAIELAFSSSSQLVVEADMTNPSVPDSLKKLTTSGVYMGKNEDLWKDIGLAMSQGLKVCVASAGLPPAMFDRLKPWLAAITLEAFRLKSLGYDEDLGLDRHFILKAKERGMPIGELETVEEQMGIFTQMTNEESKQLLRVTVLECGQGEEAIHELIDVWRTGDLAGFERVYFQIYDQYPDLAPLLDKVIFNRNDTMHERLQPYLRPNQTTFVVIGAAHMVGDRGLPELFRAQGMKVTRY